jgi:hypothetical protein
MVTVKGAVLAGAGQSTAWESHVATEVRIELPGGAVRVFPGPPLQASGPYPDPGGRPITVITAGAPLTAELTRRGLHWWPAAGADSSWTRARQGAAVPGLSEADALELATRLGQEAIIVLTPASRRVIDCATGRRSVTGWVIVSEADLAEQDLEADLEDDLDLLVADHGPDPRGWGIPVLAESRWDSGPAGPGPGSGEPGSPAQGGPEPVGDNPPVAGEFLVLLRGHYVIYETEGVEWGWDHIEAGDDESAIAAFRLAVGEG